LVKSVPIYEKITNTFLYIKSHKSFQINGLYEYAQNKKQIHKPVWDGFFNKQKQSKEKV
jgi:hypothetical protein